MLKSKRVSLNLKLEESHLKVKSHFKRLSKVIPRLKVNLNSRKIMKKKVWKVYLITLETVDNLIMKYT